MVSLTPAEVWSECLAPKTADVGQAAQLYCVGDVERRRSSRSRTMVSDVSKVSGNLSVYIFWEILFPFGGRTGILPDLGGFQNLAAVQCSAVQCSAVQCSAVQCSEVAECSGRGKGKGWLAGITLMGPVPPLSSAVQCSAVQCSAVQCSGHWRK